MDKSDEVIKIEVTNYELLVILVGLSALWEDGSLIDDDRQVARLLRLKLREHYKGELNDDN